MEDNTPLVSVAVITYNSGKTVIDTLDSVKNQTYRNIQLIISDDFSTDDTIQKCTEWVDIHKERFTDVKIQTSDINTGIPGNCNRGLVVTKGKWIKFIAGDDMLSPSCLSDYIDFVNKYPETLIAYSLFISFCGTKSACLEQRTLLPNSRFLKDFNQCTTSSQQLKVYLKYEANITPPLFCNKNIFNLIGGYNERYRYFEDTPFLVEVLRKGIKISFLDKVTVYYRQDTDSVTRDINNVTFYKRNFVDCNLLFRKEKIYPLYRWYNLSFWIKECSFLFLYHFTLKVLNNRRTKTNQFIYYVIKSLNPYYLLKTFFKC